MAGVLILIGWRFRIKPPGLFALYVAFYTFGRTFEELLRIDPSHHFLGERLNFWVSLVVCVASVVVLRLVAVPAHGRRRPRPSGGARSRRGPQGPAMAVPKGRVRPRR